MKGINVSQGFNVSDLYYVGNILLLTSSFLEMQDVLHRVSVAATPVGLMFSIGKKKAVTNTILTHH